MRAWELCSTGFTPLSTAPARYGMISVLKYRINRWKAERSHPPGGLKEIAALRHLAACDYSMVIIPSYERICLSHWAKGIAGMTQSYPVTGLYSIIYGTLFCFFTKRKGEGYTHAGSATASDHPMATNLLNPFTLLYFQRGIFTGSVCWDSGWWWCLPITFLRGGTPTGR